MWNATLQYYFLKINFILEPFLDLQKNCKDDTVLPAPPCSLLLISYINTVHSLQLMNTESLLSWWPKSLIHFFHKIKNTFFILTDNVIDLDVLRMLALSCHWPLVGRGHGCC